MKHGVSEWIPLGVICNNRGSCRNGTYDPESELRHIAAIDVLMVCIAVRQKYSNRNAKRGGTDAQGPRALSSTFQ
jgi:hypothetical protein